MTKKSEGEILKEELSEGLAALRRSTTGLFVSALSGGLDIGFSLLLAATLLTLTGDDGSVLQRILFALSYAVGFVLVVIGRSELFTEQTALAVLPVLHGKATLRHLARLWGVVYVGNVIGVTAFALILVLVGPALEIIEPEAFIAIGEEVVRPTWWVMLMSAALAGWLMGLLSWLVSAAKETISQILIVVIITGSIGFALLHHSILGVAEVVAAMLSGPEVTPLDLGRFVIWVTLGNALGGALFVGGLKYTHAIRGGRLQSVDLEPPD